MSSEGSLYIVATPIGNLEDLSDRAKNTLSKVDLVLCEDTRVTRKLLSSLDIKVATSSIHQHSTEKEISTVMQKLLNGSNIAFVSDAGTPGISDPGGKLVEAAYEHGIHVIGIPGPSAVTLALSISGFPADHFTFVGFPPHKKGRVSFFEEIKEIKQTVVLYESKHRIEKTLEQLPQDRLMMLGRELTKMHEQLYRGTVAEISSQLKEGSGKGEFVIVLAPKKWK